MESFYLIIVGCLILLAISDLVVGVSNDAVNFLNSAFGSKVARRKTVLIVATIGILAGSVSSSGMMEIARKGIFNPEMFSFADIMTIFLAVMITDIILLDLFNTFGMPTSTTVSIMFELLGAAFTVSCITIFQSGDSITTLGEYLNTSNALLIIAGIFLSVFIAFTLGLFVQYITRLVFSFKLDQSLKRFGAVFGGIAITAITYFLLIKGMKGSSLVSGGLTEWISGNTLFILGILFLICTAICFLLSTVLNVNVLKVVVLTGTFSLAMAFAGNDLVNFIGVPLAGLQSYEIFQTAGVGAAELKMAVLGESLQTNTFILFFAGLVMIATLWFSKKARSVTETEINLARQNEGAERFRPNFVARAIVKMGLKFGAVNKAITTDNFRSKLDKRFEPNYRQNENRTEAPAFDLVRASVNLMMASVLIALATSLKLPLSTTYVSFMVAMGTSLADRAWDRESAVYRVSGVINVIGGWLFTAVIAFVAAGVLALAIYFGGIVAITGLMLLTGFLIVRSQLLHKKMTVKNERKKSVLVGKKRIAGSEVFEESKHHTSVAVFKFGYILTDFVKGLHKEDKAIIKKAQEEVSRHKDEYENLQHSLYYYLKKIDSDDGVEGQFYLHAINHLQNISQSVQLIGDRIYEHLNNLHKPLSNKKNEELKILTAKTNALFIELSDLLLGDGENLRPVVDDKIQEILDFLDELEQNQIKRVKGEMSSPKNSMLYLVILIEYRDILSNIDGLINRYNDELQVPPGKPTNNVKIAV